MDGVCTRTADRGFGEVVSMSMRIWIDLSNSPHVSFFTALAEEFEFRGHTIVWTARDYAQTVELTRNAEIDASVFGAHGGGNIFAKATKFAGRIASLTKWARTQKIDLVVVHNSQEPLIVARILGFDSVNLMDYEHHPGNHLSFRTAKRLIVPASFPAEALAKFGASEGKVKRFDGLKEDVYLAGFQPDPAFPAKLKKLGINSDDILVVVRPHAPEALYNRGFENDLLDLVLDKCVEIGGVKIILLPRKDYQGVALRTRHPQPNIIIPPNALDGANLLAAADLVISGGGTMNREAAALGVPTATIFTGNPAAIDEYLIDQGRMTKLMTAADVDAFKVVKKSAAEPRRETQMLTIVADLILNTEATQR